MQVIQIPFEQLKISKFNMRCGEKKPDLSHILPSVREKGVLIPLLVRPEDGIYGVVAGRTRWFCCNEIVQEGGSVEALSCCVMVEGDDAAALEASIIENYARKDPDPLTQCENFTHLLKLGRSIEGIGLVFGLKPHEVKQRLALAKLHSSQGKSAQIACREAGISEKSYYRWRKEYGGLDLDQARRMKDLEKENGRLKRLVADLSLEKQVLKDIASGNL